MTSLEPRIIEVEGDPIIIFEIGKIYPESLYSVTYQNKDTRVLDERFGLTGQTVSHDSYTSHYLKLSTGSCSLGDTHVEMMLRHFAILAGQAGNFIGIKEEELKQHLKLGKLKHLSEYNLEKALEYQDWMNKGVTYLQRLSVEGSNVLFPKNINKMLF